MFVSWGFHMVIWIFLLFYVSFFQTEAEDLLLCARTALKCLPIKSLLAAFLPFFCYLIVFRYYQFFRDVTGLSQVSKPNFYILPWLEKKVFHCLPHQILAQYSHPILDFFAAVPYLIHFPLPLLFFLYLAFNRRRRHGVYAFLWCAGWVNLSALLIQFLFPTAPPWFTDSAVFDEEDGHLISVSPNEAGFERLDALMGWNVFHNIYSKSPVKYGAFPSLHVAWPTIILVCRPWVNEKFATLHVVWIAWAALYSNHHYGVDAVAGILLVLLVNYMMTRVWSPFRNHVVTMSDVSPLGEKDIPREKKLSCASWPLPV